MIEATSNYYSREAWQILVSRFKTQANTAATAGGSCVASASSLDAADRSRANGLRGADLGRRAGEQPQARRAHAVLTWAKPLSGSPSSRGNCARFARNASSRSA